jgi:hypothetical protein
LASWKFSSALDPAKELLEIARRAPSATLCLATALARHDLSDEIPSSSRHRAAQGHAHAGHAAPVQWHHFDRATFEIGREALQLDEGTSIGLYTAERCITDAFRTRATGGHELAYEALKRWSRSHGANAGALLKLAAAFPRTVTPIRKALEILL